jgi:hypothetical protein
MDEKQYRQFVESGDSLWVFEGDKLVFTSSEKMLLPMLRYIKESCNSKAGIVIFDKIIGNAAALLMVIAGCHEAWSPLASRLALSTLDANAIKYHIDTVVPVIQKAGTEDICPMERLSTGKDPQGLYALLKDLV